MQSAIPSSNQPLLGTRSAVWPVSRTGNSIPVYVYAVVFSSLCVVVGLLWDIMWHISIGRDGLFAPPHVVIYVGAVVSGLFSAYQILNLTLTRNHPDRIKSVRFWGVFYAPLGAMFCVWGALAMLTSAPFDDWWHNTYGLDVQILTPPHTILAIGIMTVQFGAMVGVLTLQNQYRTTSSAPAASLPTDSRATRLKWLFAISAGLLLAMLFTLASESMGMQESHNSVYYATAAIVLPFYLLAVGRASMLRWPLTTIAGIYMLALVVPSWVIQNFPATPRLGPVLNPITHYQPFHFPMLLVIPALAVDWLMRRFERTDGARKPNDWLLSVIYGVTLLVVVLLVQWPFGEFLLTSPLARNGFFLSYSWSYDNPADWQYRFAFGPWYKQSAAEFALGFGKALLYAILSARIGLLWGNWMKKVVR
ncbi:hypothetical protein [Spirosoma sordidisoli]|uniref:hypothetical protein n=1 Tax=Spirosoma sordidisoli TaxID=2502893 RepID=UPI002699F851